MIDISAIPKDPARLRALAKMYVDINREKDSAKRAETSLREFVKEAWHVVEPSTEFIPGFHLDAVCDHLQAMTKGDIKNLVINVPPRTAKSLCVSVFWPAWEWITNPSQRWLFMSYASSLSIRDSVKCRRLIQSKWYQRHWGDRYKLTGDQNAKERYETDKTGHRISSSVGGMGTGEGGDRIVCFPYDTAVTTNQGYIKIGEIVEGRLPVKVLSFDHASNTRRWQTIEEYESAPGRDCVTIEMSNGESFSCTEDHPVYALGLGYVCASKLKSGDELIDDGKLHDVRSGRKSSTIAHPEVQKCVLQHGMQDEMDDRGERSQLEGRGRNEHLPNMREGISSPAGSGWYEEILFLRMQGQGTSSSRYESSTVCGDADSSVRSLPFSREANKEQGKEQEALLLQEMFRNRPQCGNEWGEQSELCSWAGKGQPVSIGFCEDGSVNSQKGQVLCDVSIQATGIGLRAERSPYRLQQKEQRTGKPNVSVPEMPQQNARGWSSQGNLEGIFVVRVVPAPTPEKVYNIRVSEDHNYFVGKSALVHNCDDPHNASEAESDNIRQGVLDWWSTSMATRSNSNAGSRLIVQQRLHESDLAGYVLENEKHYEHLVLPMRYDPQLKSRTSLNFVDPRTVEGELLWPARFREEDVKKIENSLGEYRAAGQLGQRPSPGEGGIFKNHWWKYWQPKGAKMPPVAVKSAEGKLEMREAIELPDYFGQTIQSWDAAMKDTKDSDFSVGIVVGALGANRYVLDCEHGRMELPELISAVRRLSMRWPNAHLKLIEDKANGPAVIQSLRSEIGGLVEINPEGGKVARARSMAPSVESGNWYLPHPQLADWTNKLIAECGGFPNASHDDIVDALSQACLRLLHTTPLSKMGKKPYQPYQPTGEREWMS